MLPVQLLGGLAHGDPKQVGTEKGLTKGRPWWCSDQITSTRRPRDSAWPPWYFLGMLNLVNWHQLRPWQETPAAQTYVSDHQRLPGQGDAGHGHWGSVRYIVRSSLPVVHSIRNLEIKRQENEDDLLQLIISGRAATAEPRYSSVGLRLDSTRLGMDKRTNRAILSPDWSFGGLVLAKSCPKGSDESTAVQWRRRGYARNALDVGLQFWFKLHVERCQVLGNMHVRLAPSPFPLTLNKSGLTSTLRERLGHDHGFDLLRIGFQIWI
ncbi:hypothetical protein TWF718_002711 [Orbilia javanica]|uniref:Uncharacterized protein n=1 Tax=Orbilia javanica TaxID=47235 RepID=A0AAN8MSI1_9PEZI